MRSSSWTCDAARTLPCYQRTTAAVLTCALPPLDPRAVIWPMALTGAHMRAARSLLCTLVVIPLRLTAQAEPTTAPGDRVRVVAPVVSKASLTGTFVSH